MFKLSATELHNKTDAELTNLFNQASREIAQTQRLSARFASASVALCTIRAELDRRGLSFG